MFFRKRQTKRQEAVAKLFHSSDISVPVRLVGVAVAAIIITLLFSTCGCTEQYRQMFKNAAVSVGDCAFHTSLACASQASAGCEKPSGGKGYGEFGQCLVDKSASCSGRGLGLCLLKGIANVVGSTSVAAGGVGCAGNESLDQVRSCVADTTLESESEAVSAVAYCYRFHCLEGPGTEP